MFALLLASESFYRIVWKKRRRFTFLVNYTEKWKIWYALQSHTNAFSFAETYSNYTFWCA